MGVGGQRHALATFNPGKDQVPILQEAFRASSQSLFRLSYPLLLHFTIEMYWRIGHGGHLSKQMTNNIVLKFYGNYF